MKNTFNKQLIYNLWAKESTIKLDKKVYRVGRMSYGQYFLEPTSWEGGEKDGFSPATIWLKPCLPNTDRLLIED